MKSVTAAQERLDMRSGCHAEKILPVGVRGTKNAWCLSSLLLAYDNMIWRMFVLIIQGKHRRLVFIYLYFTSSPAIHQRR